MSRPVGNAIVYAAAVFAAGFVFGTVRTLWLAPQIGALAAVAVELPFMLAVSWLVAGAVLRRRPLPGMPQRLAMGAVAFALLMAAEALLARAFGQSPAAWLAALATPAGALGLAGQAAFALVPALRR